MVSMMLIIQQDSKIQACVSFCLFVLVWFFSFPFFLKQGREREAEGRNAFVQSRAQLLPGCVTPGK